MDKLGISAELKHEIKGKLLMSPEQEAHLAQIKEAFAHHVEWKYRRGQAEHCGDLFAHQELALIDMALDEIVDQYVYLQALRNRLVNSAKVESQKHTDPPQPKPGFDQLTRDRFPT